MPPLMSLLWFAEWLDTHAWSTALHESLWMYPLIESTHVWALALFVGFSVLLDLRLTKVNLADVAALRLKLPDTRIYEPVPAK